MSLKELAIVVISVNQNGRFFSYPQPLSNSGQDGIKFKLMFRIGIK